MPLCLPISDAGLSGCSCCGPLDFRIPSASLCKRSTVPFIISAPDIYGHEVLVIEASCANEFLEELVQGPRDTGTHEEVAVRLDRLHRTFENGVALPGHTIAGPGM